MAAPFVQELSNISVVTSQVLIYHQSSIPIQKHPSHPAAKILNLVG